jgi:hypothetical protein
MLIALALACVAPDDTADDAMDLVVTYPETDAQIVLEPPPIRVEPYADVQSCYFATYEGPDVGVYDGTFRQHGSYGHHVIVMRTNADPDDVPDGTVVDCTETDSLDMTEMEPFVLPSDIQEGGLTYLELPEGMANKLKSGTRILVQSHYINYEAEPIRVNDRIELWTVPIDEVETFAAPLVHTDTGFVLDPGMSTVTVDCTFEEDHSFLYLLGHMHEWGAALSIDYNKADGSTERLYDIPEWDALYRDLPPVTRYDDAPLQVLAGESFTTTCVFDNDTGEPLDFPTEMCVATGIVYPATIPFICNTAD